MTIAKECGSVALFFRAGKPHRLAPSGILVVLNYDSGVNRTLKYRGFLDGVEARRSHTADELEYLGHVYRYRFEFYPSWHDLISEEEYLLANNPHIGASYLATIRELSQRRDYQPAKPLREPILPTEEERIATLVAELEARHGRPDLNEFERRAAANTARAIGAMQPTLFGQPLDLDPLQQAA